MIIIINVILKKEKFIIIIFSAYVLLYNNKMMNIVMLLIWLICYRLKRPLKSTFGVNFFTRYQKAIFIIAFYQCLLEEKIKMAPLSRIPQFKNYNSYSNSCPRSPQPNPHFLQRTRISVRYL